jgi:uncharacterized repeat protein (TIGR01451 family)
MTAHNGIGVCVQIKISAVLQGLAAVCIAATASAVSGQNAIQLFSTANVRVSTQGTGYGDKANTFNSTILNLNCAVSPVHAVLSSSPDGNGNVLVDNFVSLSVGGATPVDICKNGTSENGGQQNCFTPTYASPASEGKLTGQDPDGLASSGGVPPIDVSSDFSPGAIQAQIRTVDTGGYLTSSTLYLVTNCTNLGISGSGNITGNPISSSNPTSEQLTQSYPFSSSNNLQLQFSYDLSQANNSGTLSIPDGSTPSTANTPIDPTNFQTNYLHGTSFATANCLLHDGELFNGSPACELYTLTCQVGTNPTQKGALCPASQERNEFFQEVFDGPSFTLPDIPGTDGLTFHQGVGLLEAKEGWGGGTCVFDSASSIANQLCPQNVLTNFSGPGVYRSGGPGQSPNSGFITVVPVPEDLTTVTVSPQLQPGNWINKQSAIVNFVSTPPAVASNNNFVAAPIQSLTYGISSASNVPQPGSPIPGDITVPNTACPAPGSANPPPATVFTPSPQPISVSADGSYLLHYFAQDCAGTEELKFTQIAGSWSTSFYTFPINVDTVFPVVASGPTLSPPPSTNGGVPNSYVIGQKVTANYSCTDDRSGIVKCGAFTYAPGTTLNTGNLSSAVDTSKAGPQTFTVNAVDAAGNTTTASVNYTVVAPSVSLGILKLAPLTVKRNTQLTYGITAVNLGKQTASAVTITDPLPAGVTFVKASAQQLICSNGKCSNGASCTFASNTVSCSAPSMTILTPVVVEIVVSVQASTGTKITNTATVTSANPVVPPGNTHSTATTLVK